MGCHFLLQEIFPTQESNRGLLHYRQILYQLSYEGSLFIFYSFNMIKVKLKKKSGETWPYKNLLIKKNI